MTLAATRRYALALSGVIGLVSIVLAGALIAVVLGNPERVAVAATDRELSTIVRLVIDGLALAALELLQFLS